MHFEIAGFKIAHFEIADFKSVYSNLHTSKLFSSKFRHFKVAEVCGFSIIFGWRRGAPALRVRARRWPAAHLRLLRGNKSVRDFNEFRNGNSVCTFVENIVAIARSFGEIRLLLCRHHEF